MYSTVHVRVYTRASPTDILARKSARVGRKSADFVRELNGPRAPRHADCYVRPGTPRQLPCEDPCEEVGEEVRVGVGVRVDPRAEVGAACRGARQGSRPASRLARAARSARHERLVGGLLSDAPFPREDVRWRCARIHLYVYCA